MRQILQDLAFWTLVFLALLLLYWCVFIYGPNAKVTAQDKETTSLKKVVQNASQAEMDWYKNPASNNAKKELLRWVAFGPKYTAVSNLVALARQNRSRLEERSTRLIESADLSVETDGYETVITRQTSSFYWTSGKEWHEQSKRHTYRLTLESGQWKIYDDQPAEP